LKYILLGGLNDHLARRSALAQFVCAGFPEPCEILCLQPDRRGKIFSARSTQRVAAFKSARSLRHWLAVSVCAGQPGTDEMPLAASSGGGCGGFKTVAGFCRF